jgi:carbamoyltransferase
MRVLGVSCDYHDAAAALIIDGQVVGAAEEERFSRLKHDNSLPEQAVTSLLACADLDAADIDAVVFHEKPLNVLSRVLAARQRRGPKAINAFRREMPVLMRRNLLIGYRIERMMRQLGAKKAPPVYYSEHHLSHAAAAFLPSPFESAAILTIDGIGEWATATIGEGANHRVDLIEEQRYPNSLGLLYSLITEWCGFEANDGEYKLMGLAPYGEPRFRDAIESIATLGPDGSVGIDTKAVRWWGDPVRKMRHLEERLGGPPRAHGDPVSARDRDLARSIQDFVEDAVLRMAERAHELTASSNLCMAGGVALNCVANGRLLRDGPFDRLWVQPAAGDAGSALGAALWYWHSEKGSPRHRERSSPDAWTSDDDGMNGAQLGPWFDPDEVRSWLDSEGIGYQHLPDEEQRCAAVAARLAAGEVIGWFEGRMEFGPRSPRPPRDPRGPQVDHGAARHQPAGEGSGVVPTVRPRRPGRASNGVVRSGPALAVHAAHLPGSCGEAGAGGPGAGRSGCPRAGPAIADPGVHPHRRVGPGADGGFRGASGLPSTDRGVRVLDRLSGAAQHVVQSCRRADRVLAGSRSCLGQDRRTRSAGDRGLPRFARRRTGWRGGS